MQRSRLTLSVVLAAGLLSATLVGGAAVVLERAWQATRSNAEIALQRTAQVVENTFNRQLLQADSALAGLPELFAVAVAKSDPPTQFSASQLLQALTAQSLTFRDLSLVRADGSLFATARPRGRSRPIPFMKDAVLSPGNLGATGVAGPVRNSLTGEWALYLTRPVVLPTTGELLAVAEMPLATLVTSLADAAGDVPGLVIALETQDGRLLASHPHDERSIGRPRAQAVSKINATGSAFTLPEGGDLPAGIAVARPTFYGDIRVAVTLDRETVFASWIRDRDRLIVVVALAELLVLASAAALLWAARRQRQLELEREIARRQLHNAIDAMSDGFVMWDRDDRLITCNAKYLELYKLSAPFIRPGARFEDIMLGGYNNGQYPQAGPDREAWLKEIVAWHRGSHGSIERLLPDGRWLLVTERRTATGEIVGIRTDITTLKNALDELAAANGRAGQAMEEALAARAAAEAASEAKTEFLASMSHEIRTPLNGVLGYTDLLLEDATLTGPQRHHVERIQTAGSALLTVVDDILDFSKIEAGQVDLDPVPFPLAVLVDNTVSITRATAERKGLAFDVRLADNLPPDVVGDHDRLRQVLLNLINNAIKFTQTGAVTLTLDSTERSDGDGWWVTFTVRDTGIGIPQGKLHRLFQRFSQVDGSVHREFGGTGLGLAICKRLVELMGGEIGVESEHLKGATFWFKVPLSRPQAGWDALQASAATPLALHRARILLAEDLEINQDLARAVLQSAGHQVDVVSDGAAAVAAVQQAEYDLVLMDVQMPGMDGMTATRHIRALQSPASSVVIVAMTANVLPQQIAAFREAGMNDHVGKPFKRHELLSKVAEWTKPRGLAADPKEQDMTGGHPVLDRETLEGLRDLVGDDKLRAMLDRFAGDLASRFGGVAPPDRDRLAADAHAMSSSAGALGFMRLSALCREVEIECHAGGDPGDLLKRLHQDVQFVLDTIGTLQAPREDLLAPAAQG